MSTGISSMAQLTNTGGTGSFYTPAGSPGAYQSSAGQGVDSLYNDKMSRNAKLISGSLGTASALGAIASGFAQSASLRTEAYNMDYQAKAAQLEGQRQALLALDDFSQSQARAVAAIGASGVGYEGSPVAGLYQNERKSQSDQALIKAGTQVQVAGYKAQAKQIRKSARLAPLFGFLKAGEQVGSIFMGGRGGY